MSSDWYARRFGGNSRTAPPPPQRPVYHQGQQAPVDYHQPQYQEPDTSQIRVTPENFLSAASMWKGGPGAKADRHPCPNCGSNLYYSRAGKSRMPAPAPHCFSCGFNGLFDQGDPQSWGAN